MRTNGLVWALALSLGFTGALRADEDAKKDADSTPPAASCEESATQDSSCSNYLAGCCDTPLFSSFYAGTEFSFLNIHSRTGGTTTASFSDTTAPGVSTIAFKDQTGVDDWGSAGRVWIGTQVTENWGVEARYWRLGDNEPAHFPELNPAIPRTGTNFGTFEETDSVTAQTIDVEAVRRWDWDGFKGDFFVGGRHGEFRTDSQLLNFGVFTTGNFINLTLQNGCEFYGEGVTYGGTLRHQVFNPHLVAFATVRGSALDGESNSMGRADGAVASSPSAPLVGAATVRRDGADARMYIFELETGAQFEYPLEQIPATFFFRGAYEMQKWDIDGLPTGGAGFGGTIGELTTNSFASAGLGGMLIQGLSLGTGITW